MKKYATRLFAVLAAVMILFAGCTAPSGESGTVSADTTQSTVQAQRQSNGGVTLSNDSAKSFDYSTVPKFDDKPYVEINGNVPYFTKSELTTKSYESYGELDKYGRCTMCIASVGTDLMPTEERGAIGSIKPTGWHTVKYNNVDGKYLYNRCHLIGYQLSGENANAKNLITGTRYLNIDGMLPFENEVGEPCEGEHINLTGKARSKGIKHTPVAFKGELPGNDEHCFFSLFGKGAEKRVGIGRFSHAFFSDYKIEHPFVLLLLFLLLYSFCSGFSIRIEAVTRTVRFFVL